MKLEYDIEADWNLLTTCNFRCEYCFVPTDALGAKLAVHGTPEEWAGGFKATKKRWLIHITGGEPSLYPGFTDLCVRLTQDHFLSINSNLSHPSIETFAEKVNPDRVHFINAAVHLAERQKKSSLELFIRRVQLLQAKRFNILLSLVMTPAMVELFPEISAEFRAHGLAIIPKMMRETYQGKQYPEAYSEAQKSFICEQTELARQRYAGVVANMGEPATIDLFANEQLFRSAGNYRGRRCGSGYNFVRIRSDGTLVRCSSGKTLGNILRRNVRLLAEPKICDTSYCPYFCEKYTTPQFTAVRTEASPKVSAV